MLATLLAPLKSDYDLIIIDTVPTPSVYTNNAIVASDYVMIPLQAEEESTNNIQNYISYLIDLQEQFNPGLDMIGFVPYLVDTDSATIKSNLEELYKEHEEDNLVFQNIIKRSNKVSAWSKNGITEHKGYDKKVLSMYENVFFELLRAIKNRYNIPVVLVNFNILKNISKFLQNVVVLDLIEHCKPVICFQIYSLAL